MRQIVCDRCSQVCHPAFIMMKFEERDNRGGSAFAGGAYDLCEYCFQAIRRFLEKESATLETE